MSIRPVDLGGMIQRVQDIGILKQNEDNKPMVQQHNIQIQQEKQEDDLAHRVQQPEGKENSGQRYDAKEKGNGSYEANSKKKRKKGQKCDGKVVLKGRSNGFDMKI